jgi:tryptophan 2,3-dioxygenase
MCGDLHSGKGNIDGSSGFLNAIATSREFDAAMTSLAAAILVLAISGTAATATSAARENPAPRAKVSDSGSFDLRQVGSAASAEESRWRLRELAESVEDEEDSVVRWGWKKVTLRVPLGGSR